MDQRTRDRVINALRERLRRSELIGEPMLCTPIEVAALFKVDPRTVGNWARKGRLPSIKTLGGHHRYPWAPIKRQLELLDIRVPI